MGYTHYWYTAKTIDKKNWKDLIEAVNILFKDCEDVIQKEYNCNHKPEVSMDRIRFNGIGENGCETFVFLREGRISEWSRQEVKTSKHPCFGFCKTRYRNYDRYVTAVLILAKKYLGKQIKISSDGGLEDWQNGFDLINEKMGLNIEASGDVGNMKIETF